MVSMENCYRNHSKQNNFVGKYWEGAILLGKGVLTCQWVIFCESGFIFFWEGEKWVDGDGGGGLGWPGH